MAYSQTASVGLGQGMEEMAYYMLALSFHTTVGMELGPMAYHAILIPFLVP